jgi:hypothetical protein
MSGSRFKGLDPLRLLFQVLFSLPQVKSALSVEPGFGAVPEELREPQSHGGTYSSSLSQKFIHGLSGYTKCYCHCTS